MPDAPAFIYDVKYAGKSCGEKVAAIRTELKKKGIFALFLSSLDEIAWTLNLRGSDVHCNPVIVSYLLVTQDEVVYFISPEKITQEVNKYLQEQQVSLRKYDEAEFFYRRKHTYRPKENELCDLFGYQSCMQGRSWRISCDITESHSQ